MFLVVRILFDVGSLFGLLSLLGLLGLLGCATGLGDFGRLDRLLYTGLARLACHARLNLACSQTGRNRSMGLTSCPLVLDTLGVLTPGYHIRVFRGG